MPRGIKRQAVNGAEPETPETAQESKRQVSHRLLKPGYKMPDGLVLQRETAVEYEVRGDEKIITGPAGLRPAILLGSVLKG